MLDIQNYEQQYTITSDGVISRKSTGRILKPCVNTENGYLYVSLWKDNKGTTHSVHRLVASHFLSNPDNKPFVNHKDSNRTNAALSNLEWCTQSENIQHGYTHGFMSQETRKNFDRFELELLLQSVLSGESMTAIAKGAGVGLSRLTINLRKLAVSLGVETALNVELVNQKNKRNIEANVHKRIPIAQWTLDGILVAEHPSATSAAKALGKSSGSICNALNPNHPQQKAYEFLWTYL
jgi:hypothetical protein